jgi:hypothetical protein
MVYNRFFFNSSFKINGPYRANNSKKKKETLVGGRTVLYLSTAILLTPFQLSKPKATLIPITKETRLLLSLRWQHLNSYLINEA